jgi:hypothetical protein
LGRDTQGVEVRLHEAEGRFHVGLYGGDELGQAAFEPLAEDLGNGQRPVAGLELRAVAADQIGGRMAAMCARTPARSIGWSGMWRRALAVLRVRLASGRM